MSSQETEVNMLCQKCGIREATVHVTKIYNNHKTELDLCSQCAQEHTTRIPFDFNTNPFDLDSLITGFFGINPEQEFGVISESQQDRCSYCGTTLNEIKESGRAGCANCYQKFRHILLPIIKKVHGSTHHTGKAPERIAMGSSIMEEVEEAAAAKSNSLDGKILQLKNEMKEAIKNEEYEKAAVLRDQIRDLEEQLKKSGGEK